MKKDGRTDEKAHERKLKWDEENRLLASDDDGFVTNYWYGADGERTVKTSGGSEQMYVNSGFAGGRTSMSNIYNVHGRMAYHDGTNYVLYCIAPNASLGTCPLTQGCFAFDPRVLGHEP